MGVSLFALAGDVAAAPRDAEQIDVERDHGCVVTSCGEVECWGRNDWGQSADRSPSLTPVWIGAPSTPVFEEVAVGQYHTCALDEHGDVDCWGKGNYGQSADRSGPFVDMDAGYNHNCAVRGSDGGIECWGTNSHGASTPPSGSFEAVSAGLDFGCAVETGGQAIRCWGNNGYGQAPASVQPPGVYVGEVFTDVSVASYHACASTNWGGGKVYCWGYEPYVSLGGSTIPHESGLFEVPYSATLEFDASPYGLIISELNTGDPVVHGFGWTASSYPIPWGTEGLDVAMGANHWCIVDPMGDVECEGNNGYGKSDAPSMAGNCPTPGFGTPTLPSWP
ncbi:MAG: hypothetical protein AB1Z98_09500 [Nannocystaceae bacterium]